MLGKGTLVRIRLSAGWHRCAAVRLTGAYGSKHMAVDKNSKTYKNLEYAFAGESMARNKYTYFASVARKAG